jgi:hypothetical protein
LGQDVWVPYTGYTVDKKVLEAVRPFCETHWSPKRFNKLIKQLEQWGICAIREVSDWDAWAQSASKYWMVVALLRDYHMWMLGDDAPSNRRTRPGNHRQRVLNCGRLVGRVINPSTKEARTGIENILSGESATGIPGFPGGHRLKKFARYQRGPKPRYCVDASAMEALLVICGL